MEELSQQQWKKFLHGEDRAYSWIYSFYVQDLYQFGRRFTGDSDLVKDCIQDVFTTIYQKKREIGHVENVRGYLMYALKNRILYYFRKQELDDKYSQEIIENLYNFDLSIENAFINNESIKEKQKSLHETLNSLTSRQKEIIYYRFYVGLNYKEICQLMNMNEQSAYNLLQRTLSKIRDTYNGPLILGILLNFANL